MCRDGIRKAKALNLARDMKNNKVFHGYINMEREAKESVRTLIDEMIKVGVENMEKADVVQEYIFYLSLSWSQAFHVSHFPVPVDWGWGKRDVPGDPEEGQRAGALQEELQEG